MIGIIVEYIPMQPTILEKIKEYDEDEFYETIPEPYIDRGESYFRRNKVVAYKLSSSGNTLNVKVQGSKLYDVTVKNDDGDLSFQCNCPIWHDFSHCKHVVCTYLTLKNKLENNKLEDEVQISLFPELSNNQNVIPLVSNQCSNLLESVDLLLQKGKERLGITFNLRVHIEPVDNRKIKFYINVSDKLRELIYELNPSLPRYEVLDRYDFKVDELILELSKRNIIFVVRTELGNINPTFQNDLEITSKCLFDIQQDRSLIKPVAFIKDENKNIEIKDFVLIGKFILDINNKKIGRLIDGSGIQLYNRLNNEIKYESAFGGFYLISKGNHISNYLFNEKVSSLNLNSFILKKNGLDFIPSIYEPEYEIHLSRWIYDDEKIEVSFKMFCGGNNIFRETYLKRFITCIEDADYGALSNKNVQKLLMKGMLNLTSAKNKSEINLIKKGIFIASTLSYWHIRDSAKNAIDKFIKVMDLEEQRRLAFINNDIIELKQNIKKELSCLAKLYLIFGSAVIESIYNNGEFVVNREKFFKDITSLKSFCDEHHIKLYLENKLLKTKTLDINIDASIKTEIDWFEIKPEILCEGKLLSPEDWEKIILNMGTIEDEDGVSLIDINSLSTLQIVSKLLKKNKSKEKEKRKIIEIPRLQILDWVYLRNNGVKVKLSDEDEKIIENLINFKKIKKKNLPKKLNATLRDYQKDGYNWLSFLYEHKFGACLADDMGLGKTIQAITFLAGIKEKIINIPERYFNKPHLIILPPSLIFNWKNEIEKFYPDLKICEYIGSGRKFEFDNVDIIITSYETLRRDIEKFKNTLFNVIIFDEAQNIKNIYAGRTSSVRQLNANFKLCLTGTPLENHIGEYYSIVDLAVPGLLEEYKEFMSIAKGDGIDIVVKRTKPFVLRRCKSEILKELPEKVESDVYLEMTSIQKAFYVRMVNEIRQVIEEAYRDKPAQQAGIIALTAILRLRQICVSPKLVDKNFSERSPKLEYLINKIVEVISEGHSSLLFSQFTGCLDILEEELKKENIDYLRMDGKTPTNKRQEIIKNFQEGNKKIFLISLKTGGVGLNLTRASYVFHVDPWWNPSVENQATDRAHRIGQENTVFVNRILMHGSIEEKMMKLKEIKKELYDRVVNFSEGASTKFSITKKDFEFLLN